MNGVRVRPGRAFHMLTALAVGLVLVLKIAAGPVLVPTLAAAADGRMLVPICGAGTITYVMINLGSEEGEAETVASVDCPLCGPAVAALPPVLVRSGLALRVEAVLLPAGEGATRPLPFATPPLRGPPSLS
jgi:hypothetical protein